MLRERSEAVSIYMGSSLHRGENVIYKQQLQAETNMFIILFGTVPLRVPAVIFDISIMQF